ncbi:N-acetylmuramoyl-L-alanine amidase [Verrucomicrobiota bacterium]
MTGSTGFTGCEEREKRWLMKFEKYILGWSMVVLLFAQSLTFAQPIALFGRRKSDLNISNYYSPRNKERPARKQTSYIILHTTEGPKTGSLKKVHAKGETHYFVDTAGRVYRIIERNRVALHAGRSIWDGRTNIDNYSIGIEVVGYHNRGITSAQSTALKELLLQLQKMYRIPDERVLTHSMVAYGAPNRWHKRSHRGRKRCGMLFARRSVRLKLGLDKQPLFDPDVKAGRLVNADAYLAKVLYGSAQEQESAAQMFAGADVNIISSSRSAWDIARDRYRSSDTIYVFPDGKKLRGNQIRDWRKIPVGTKVIQGTDQRDNVLERVKVLGVDGNTAQDVAGDEFNGKTTIYFLPGGKIKRGNELSEKDFKSFPKGTKVLVGYTDGERITAKRSAFDVCGKRWNFPSTFYYLPDGSIVSGANINEKAIPVNTLVFYQN